ncbi:hypothetical protein TNCV_389511 [Trichonephila clavipes]|nr:hypothetical protein TNCV_389511 [Trichonephila clavipes]
MQEESDPVDDERDEDQVNNNESSKNPSNADVFSVLETAMEWYEQQSECCSTQLQLLKSIRDLSTKTRRLAAQNMTLQGGLNILRYVTMQKFGELDASSGVTLSFDFGSELRGSSPIAINQSKFFNEKMYKQI